MRRAVVTVAVLALVSLFEINVLAAEWPTRPITWIVPFPAGGSTDAFARPLAARLDYQFGQRIVIENRGGAGGTIGASAAAKAAPDGYTFFVGAAHHAIASTLYPRLDYDLQNDFIPVVMIARPPHVVVINPSRIPSRSLSEFVSFAKSKPDKINYASGGQGTAHHLAGELFKTLTGTALNHVPYRGNGPAMQDLIAGHVDMMFDNLATSATQINSGTLRALALAANERSPTLPGVITAKEAGLDNFEVASWYAIFAPKNTPSEIIERMKTEIRTALNTDEIKAVWAKNGTDIPDLNGSTLTAFVAAEVQRWRQVIKGANIKLE